MKKILISILFLSSVLSLTACSKNNEVKPDIAPNPDISITDSTSKDTTEKEHSNKPTTGKTHKINTTIYGGNGASTDAAVDIEILEMTKGPDALKIIDKHNANSPMQLDYSESIEGTDFVVLKYAVTFPEGVATSEYGTRPKLSAKITGTDKNTFKYKGSTYIGMSTNSITPDGYSAEKSLKAGETGEYYLVYGIPKGCSESEYLLEFGDYNKEKTYISLS